MKPPKARKLPSGSWFVQLRLNGESISITRATEKEAVAEAMAIKAGIKRAPNKSKRKVENDAITLRQAIDNYISARSNTLSPSTIRGYRMIQRKRFPELMERKINTLDQKELQKACNREAAACSAKTLFNAWALIAAAIKAEDGREFNVRLPQIVRREKEFLDAEQIRVFMRAIRGDAAEIAALLALHSLRRSEILALTWDNVDLSSGIIHVRGSKVQDETGKMVAKKENKNTSSRRDVPVMIPRLKELLDAEPEKSGAVVRCHPSTIFSHINRACRSESLPEVGIHGLRHSFASLAYSIGMPEKETMRLGGWSDDGTMRRIYTHVSQRDLSKHQNLMAQFYAGADSDQELD